MSDREKQLQIGIVDDVKEDRKLLEQTIEMVCKHCKALLNGRDPAIEVFMSVDALKTRLEQNYQPEILVVDIIDQENEYTMPERIISYYKEARPEKSPYILYTTGSRDDFPPQKKHWAQFAVTIKPSRIQDKRDTLAFYAAFKNVLRSLKDFDTVQGNPLAGLSTSIGDFQGKVAKAAFSIENDDAKVVCLVGTKGEQIEMKAATRVHFGKEYRRVTMIDDQDYLYKFLFEGADNNAPEMLPSSTDSEGDKSSPLVLCVPLSTQGLSWIIREFTKLLDNGWSLQSKIAGTVLSRPCRPLIIWLETGIGKMSETWGTFLDREKVSLIRVPALSERGEDFLAIIRSYPDCQSLKVDDSSCPPNLTTENLYSLLSSERMLDTGSLNLGPLTSVEPPKRLEIKVSKSKQQSKWKFEYSFGNQETIAITHPRDEAWLILAMGCTFDKISDNGQFCEVHKHLLDNTAFKDHLDNLEIEITEPTNVAAVANATLTKIRKETSGDLNAAFGGLKTMNRKKDYRILCADVQVKS